MQTKRFVGSSLNVILARHTCGQHSSRAAESKRRALGNCFSERICYMLLKSKCRGDWLHWDLGRCTFWVLTKREALRNSKFRIFFGGRNTCFFGSRHGTAVLFSQVPKKCTDLDLSLLYILISGTYSKLNLKNDFLALSVCIRSPARALAASLPRQDHVYKTTDESFRFTTKKSMKCVVNWIPLRIHVRSRSTQPHLEW